MTINHNPSKTVIYTQMSNALIDSDADRSVSPSPSSREENQPVDTDTGLVQMANKGAAIDLIQLFLRLELKLVTFLKELNRDALSSLKLQVEAEIRSLRESFENLNSRVMKLESMFERSPQLSQSKEHLYKGRPSRDGLTSNPHALTRLRVK